MSTITLPISKYLSSSLEIVKEICDPEILVGKSFIGSMPEKRLSLSIMVGGVTKSSGLLSTSSCCDTDESQIPFR